MSIQVQRSAWVQFFRLIERFLCFLIGLPQLPDSDGVIRLVDSDLRRDASGGRWAKRVLRRENRALYINHYDQVATQTGLAQRATFPLRLGTLTYILAPTQSPLGLSTKRGPLEAGTYWTLGRLTVRVPLQAALTLRTANIPASEAVPEVRLRVRLCGLLALVVDYRFFHEP